MSLKGSATAEEGRQLTGQWRVGAVEGDREGSSGVTERQSRSS